MSEDSAYEFLRSEVARLKAENEKLKRDAVMLNDALTRRRDLNTWTLYDIAKCGWIATISLKRGDEQ